MKKINKYMIFAAVILVLTVMMTSYSVYSQSDTKPKKPGQDKPVTSLFKYDDYTWVLDKYVDNQGMVNYKALKENRSRLDSFNASMGDLKPEVYEKWSDKDKIAFWVNAYNAFTLQAIIDNYPVESTFIGRRLYPENSIRQIDAVWDNPAYKVMGKKVSLNNVEHIKLRAKYDEPRIHMALVCASIGCPFLRREAFIGGSLDTQLDDQTRKFLADPDKFKIDRKTNEVHISKIFSWFGDDFKKKYSDDQVLTGDKTEKAVLNYISKYVSESDSQYLRNNEFDIEYFSYDWSLNEKKE
jgi:Protein of unknown function, DUF547